MPAPDRQRLNRLIGGEALAALRRRLRKRFAASQAPSDGFTLSNLNAAESRALAGLLGRTPRQRASMRLSHTELDGALADADLADDLRAALECLDGPIADTAAARARICRAWDRVCNQATDPRLARVLTEPAGQGLLKRLAGRDVDAAARLVGQTERVLARLPGAAVARARLAADSLGDAHALDAGRPVATLVRRALAEGDVSLRPRELWASQGVLVNELAKPVAVLNLAVDGDDPGTRLIAMAAAAGEPLHLSLRLLTRRMPAWRPGQAVFVCENPEVLAAAADALGPNCPPMVSLDGQLSAAPRTLLDQLAMAGAHFYYHGDFDWPGIRIGNHVIARYNGTPWCYAALDYVPGDHGSPLAGEPVEAHWDAALAARMQAAGMAVHEESQLDDLIADLSRAAS
ncbi:TIGR02679 family protein [Salinisphaera orenii]|uniref:TIGR02679 family protein n=1 Tax=Salinisphaera orenii YIM 95161 TaxID=1051139 RepID=A0A423PRI7_9GAMM|nr:TIGR02679 family protein [Salinisphaera halophila]ROO28172.1 hypothetical protein SAHL_10290 [Salinisphaera halophila YIM 95161]